MLQNYVRTVLMFPGTDALEISEIRKSAIQNYAIQQKLLVAQNTIDSFFPSEDLNLNRFMQGPNENTPKWFMELVVSTVAAQVSIYESYVDQFGKPDLLWGCSLGDGARTVTSGATDFDDAIFGIITFAKAATQIRHGAMVAIKIIDPNLKVCDVPLNPGLEISVQQTPKHCLVGGLAQDLSQWVITLDKNLFAAKLVYPFPLHTKVMNPVLEQMMPIIPNFIKRGCHTPIFSSTSNRILVKREDLMADLASNIVETVRWNDGFNLLLTQGYDTFINIGPSPTLLKFNEVAGYPSQVTQMDYFKVLTSQKPVTNRVPVDETSLTIGN